MVNYASNPKVKCFIICFVAVVVLTSIVLYKPPLKNITDTQLDALHGVKYDGVMFYRIKNFIAENPSCKVEDLRLIVGVDDMIIDQLKGRFR